MQVRHLACVRSEVSRGEQSPGTVYFQILPNGPAGLTSDHVNVLHGRWKHS
jgi:hypothetical protein